MSNWRGFGAAVGRCQLSETGERHLLLCLFCRKISPPPAACLWVPFSSCQFVEPSVRRAGTHSFSTIKSTTLVVAITG